mmetsp:Transcript_7074/g.28583  ORF Transcript_7074/g.28583 Transcript_7074/m.28583 type:complete len:280 (+) Transcript_7074:561-1400(+)
MISMGIIACGSAILMFKRPWRTVTSMCFTSRSVGKFLNVLAKVPNVFESPRTTNISSGLCKVTVISRSPKPGTLKVIVLSSPSSSVSMSSSPSAIAARAVALMGTRTASDVFFSTAILRMPSMHDALGVTLMSMYFVGKPSSVIERSPALTQSLAFPRASVVTWTWTSFAASPGACAEIKNPLFVSSTFARPIAPRIARIARPSRTKLKFPSPTSRITCSNIESTSLAARIIAPIVGIIGIIGPSIFSLVLVLFVFVLRRTSSTACVCFFAFDSSLARV